MQPSASHATSGQKDIRDALKERIAARQGTITAADLSAASGGATQEVDNGPSVDESLDTDTSVLESEIPSDAVRDVIASEEDRASRTASASLAAVVASPIARDEIVITADEKRQFLDQAIVNGGRYTWAYTCFGGALRAVFRSRSAEEMDAITVRTSKELSSGIITSQHQFTAVMVQRLLVCQLQSLNGVEYPPLAEPLFETVRVLPGTGKTEHVQPGWLQQVVDLFPKSEAKAEQLMRGLREFDVRYSIMLEKAQDVNFWKPVE